MRSLNPHSGAWDQPEDRDHPALLIIIALFCVGMCSLVFIYG